MKKDLKEEINKFIKELLSEKSVEIVLVSGSHVTGYNQKYSDVDINIIVSDEKNKFPKILEKRGNYIFEVSSQTIKEAIENMESKIKENNKSGVRGILISRVLYDKKGRSHSLKTNAKRLLNKKFPVLSKKEVEHLKYELWDLNTKLKNSYSENSPMFRHLYSLLLFRIIRAYGVFVGSESYSFSHYYEYLTNDKFRKMNYLQEHPDKEFVKRLIKCIKEEDSKKMIGGMDKLISYVFKKMGNFNEENWKELR